MRKLIAIVLALLCASLAWAAPNQGLLLIYNSRTESLDQHLQLAQELKKRRATGHYKSRPQFSTAFAYCDANIPQMARALKTLGLPGADTPVPYLALVSLNAQGRPTKVLWGSTWSEVDQALSALDQKLGLGATNAGPSPTPSRPVASGQGVALVGDRENPDTLALYGSTRKLLGIRYPQLRSQARLVDKPFALDFADPQQRAALEALGLRRDQAPLLLVADFTGSKPTRLLWQARVTDAELGVAQLVTHFKASEAAQITHEKDGSALILVPGGRFTMGSEMAEEDERPAHSCELRGYYIGRTEVSNAQFARFVEATGYQTEAEGRGGAHLFVDGRFTLVHGSSWKNPGGPGSVYDPKKPVIAVTIKDAQAYVQWAGLRLPTEEEWELAARGLEGRIYPWGANWEARLCCNSVGIGMGGAGGPQPVGSYPGGASPYGCLDMAGNVYEWTTSLYSRYPGSTYESQRMDGINLTIRGGSWGDPREESFRGWNRTFGPPNVALSSLGFRVARDR